MTPKTKTRHGTAWRIAAGILAIAGMAVIATAPASAGQKHKHHPKHGHGAQVRYEPYYYRDAPRVVYVQPRTVYVEQPVYVAPPPVYYYQPAPVVYERPSINIVVPIFK